MTYEEAVKEAERMIDLYRNESVAFKTQYSDVYDWYKKNTTPSMIADDYDRQFFIDNIVKIIYYNKHTSLGKIMSEMAEK